MVRKRGKVLAWGGNAEGPADSANNWFPPDHGAQRRSRYGIKSEELVNPKYRIVSHRFPTAPLLQFEKFTPPAHFGTEATDKPTAPNRPQEQADFRNAKR